MNEYCLHTFIKSKNCKSNHCKLGLSMYVLSLSTSLKILVLFSRLVVSYSLRPHGLQHTNLSVIHHLPKFAQTQVHQVNDAIQPSHPLLSPFPPPSVSSIIRILSSESALHVRWPQCRSFTFSVSQRKCSPVRSSCATGS